MAKVVAHDFRMKNRTGDVIISEDVDFAGLLLSDDVLEGLADSGFRRPSPIQLSAIPLGRCGLDLIVQAKSGTGKTVVFTVIALESLQLESHSTQVLVLAPTREIAVQIWEVMTSISRKMTSCHCHMFIGGLPLHQDRQKVKQCHIAIGTPGRIKQLIESEILRTESMRLFVLDEADKLLEESFQDQINWIYSTLPDNKQILALSATYPEYLAEHLTVYMRNPTFVRLNSNDPALLGIKQYYLTAPFHPFPHKVFESKTKVLIGVLSSVSFHQCLVFSNLQSRAQNLCDVLNDKGWPTECIAGCLEQQQRLVAMEKLKAFKCRVLISTDLTSRGIDAENVNLVVNLDLPHDHETYLHRIGRAGRFGSFGAAITLISGEEEKCQLKSLEAKCNTCIQSLADPIPSDLVERDIPVDLEEIVTTEQIITRVDDLPVHKTSGVECIYQESSGKDMEDSAVTDNYIDNADSARREFCNTTSTGIAGSSENGENTGKTETGIAVAFGHLVVESNSKEAVIESTLEENVAENATAEALADGGVKERPSESVTKLTITEQLVTENETRETSSSPARELVTVIPAEETVKYVSARKTCVESRADTSSFKLVTDIRSKETLQALTAREVLTKSTKENFIDSSEVESISVSQEAVSVLAAAPLTPGAMNFVRNTVTRETEGDSETRENEGGTATTDTVGNSVATDTGGDAVKTETGRDTAKTHTGGHTAAAETGGDTATDTGGRTARTETRRETAETGGDTVTAEVRESTALTETGEHTSAANGFVYTSAEFDRTGTVSVKDSKENGHFAEPGYPVMDVSELQKSCFGRDTASPDDSKPMMVMNNPTPHVNRGKDKGTIAKPSRDSDVMGTHDKINEHQLSVQKKTRRKKKRSPGALMKEEFGEGGSFEVYNTDMVVLERPSAAVQRKPGSDLSSSEKNSQVTDARSSELKVPGPEKFIKQDLEKSTKQDPEKFIKQNPEKSTKQDSEISTKQDPEKFIKQDPEKSTKLDSEISTKQNPDKSTKLDSEISTKQNPDKSTKQDSEISTEQDLENFTKQDSEKFTKGDLEKCTKLHSEIFTKQDPVKVSEKFPDPPVPMWSKRTEEVDIESTKEVSGLEPRDIHGSHYSAATASTSAAIGGRKKIVARRRKVGVVTRGSEKTENTTVNISTAPFEGADSETQYCKVTENFHNEQTAGLTASKEVDKQSQKPITADGTTGLAGRAESTSSHHTYSTALEDYEKFLDSWDDEVKFEQQEWLDVLLEKCNISDKVCTLGDISVEFVRRTLENVRLKYNVNNRRVSQENCKVLELENNTNTMEKFGNSVENTLMFSQTINQEQSNKQEVTSERSEIESIHSANGQSREMPSGERLKQAVSNFSSKKHQQSESRGVGALSSKSAVSHVDRHPEKDKSVSRVDVSESLSSRCVLNQEAKFSRDLSTPVKAGQRVQLKRNSSSVLCDTGIHVDDESQGKYGDGSIFQDLKKNSGDTLKSFKPISKVTSSHSSSASGSTSDESYDEGDDYDSSDDSDDGDCETDDDSSDDESESTHSSDTVDSEPTSETTIPGPCSANYSKMQRKFEKPLRNPGLRQPNQHPGMTLETYPYKPVNQYSACHSYAPWFDYYQYKFPCSNSGMEHETGHDKYYSRYQWRYPAFYKYGHHPQPRAVEQYRSYVPWYDHQSAGMSVYDRGLNSNSRQQRLSMCNFLTGQFNNPSVMSRGNMKDLLTSQFDYLFYMKNP